MTSPRIAIIGPRRTRMGLGPFVLRELLRVEATVPCALGRNEASVAAACEEVSSQHGIELRGYVSFDEMQHRESLDAVAILSPSATHGAYLEAALDAGLHVLCEKPLLWGSAGLAATAERILPAFQDRGLLVWENCLWPYSLEAYHALYPELQGVAITNFEMNLAPTLPVGAMLGELISHPLSLLQALAPHRSQQIEAVEFSHFDPEASELDVSFNFRSGDHSIESEIRLRKRRIAVPEVGFGVNGKYAVRQVDPGSYRMQLSNSERSVPLSDPLSLLVRDYVGALREPDLALEERRKQNIQQRIALLETIVGAFASGS